MHSPEIVISIILHHNFRFKKYSLMICLIKIAVCFNGDNNFCDADGPMNLNAHNSMGYNMAVACNRGVNHSKAAD